MLLENIWGSTQSTYSHYNLLQKFHVKETTADKSYDLSRPSIQRKLLVEIRDVLEEADSLNDQLASVRIKKFINRIFSISMLVTPDWLSILWIM